MSYQVKFQPGALREFDKLPKEVQKSVRKVVDGLAADPQPPRAAKMTGIEAYRIRVGVYRVVYTIRDAVLLVLVVKVGHRKDVYADLDTIRRRLK